MPTRARTAHAMPYGVFVVLQDGVCRYDPTAEGWGGVIRRPMGAKNDADEGEMVEIQTDDGIQTAFPDGATIVVDGVQVRIPAGNNHYCTLRDGRIVG